MSCVLVIGSGGREHALAWKLSQSPQVTQVFVAPGNDGMPESWKRITYSSHNELIQKTLAARISLVVVGPDNALAEGIVDAFQKEGVRVFGPTQRAAQIEASKAFAKDVMRAAGVPTARYEIVKSTAEARAFFDRTPWGNGWVVKADGLALGKGVQVCSALSEALEAVERLISVSGSLVIEERLSGEEISWMAFCDGENCALLEPARDYKRVGDGDRGPNTGGMGAYSPLDEVPSGFADRVRREVFEPVLREMKRREAAFEGVLYAGLMVDFTKDQYWVLEFNARFGDPETQVLMTRLQDDLYDWCLAVADKNLARMPSQVRFKPDPAVVVIAAAEGYPDQPKKGAEIQCLTSSSWDKWIQTGEIFSAGIKKSSTGFEVGGGRVFGAMGQGASLREAKEKAYERLSKITFAGMHFRKDIAGS